MPPEAKPHPEAARIAAEVAARYGVAVRPGAVVQAPRGASGITLPVWNGYQLVYEKADQRRWGEASKAEQSRRMRLMRVDDGVIARRAEVARLHAEGLRVSEICDALNAAEHTVRQDLRTLGLPVVAVPILDPAQRLRAVISRGFSCREDMAAELGWTVKHLVKVAAGAGIDLPEPPRRRLTATPPAQAALRSPAPVEKPARPPRDPKPRNIARQIEAMKLAREGKAAARREDVARLVAQGATLAELVAATGAHKNTVHRDLSALGLKLRRPAAKPVRVPIDRSAEIEERRRSVAALASEGLTQAAIRVRLNIALDTVRRDLRALGLKPGPIRKGTFRERLMNALKAPGMTRDSLCQVLGCTRRQLSRQAAKFRVSLPTALSPVVVERRQRVAELRRQGITDRGIAAELGEKVDIVGADLRALGMGAGWQP